VTTALIQNRIGAALPHIAHASGVWLTDVSGKRYLDGCSGPLADRYGRRKLLLTPIDLVSVLIARDSSKGYTA
jgi:adenosylmethionine-8-amino-7-oxononanoate aminotransferase